jgi:hypothetical protein
MSVQRCKTGCARQVERAEVAASGRTFDRRRAGSIACPADADRHAVEIVDLDGAG